MTTNKPHWRHRLLRPGALSGMGWMVLATICFAAFAVIARIVSTDLNPVQAAFLRYAFGLLFLAPLLLRNAALLRDSQKKRLHALRGLLHGVAVMLWFFAMVRIPITDVTALGFTAPIFATIGAVIFLRETIHRRRITALCVGFVGAMIIIRPGFSVIDIGAVAMLLAAPMFAASKLIAKNLTQQDSNTTIVAYLSLVVTLVMVPFAVYVWETPNLQQLILTALTALLATASHFLMVQAYRSADLTLTQPIEYLHLLWAALAGFFFFDEVPVIWVWIGGAMIIGCAIYLAHREAKVAAHGR